MLKFIIPTIMLMSLTWLSKMTLSELMPQLTAY